MMPPPPISTLFPYTTLFRSFYYFVRGGSRSIGSSLSKLARLLIMLRRLPRSLYFVSSITLMMSSTPRPEDLSRSEEHTSELQSRQYLVCRLLLEKKKKYIKI